MKKFEAVFWRRNPQLSNGGYETTRIIEAKTVKSAEKKCKEIEDRCVYGGMWLRSLTEIVEEA